jgi:nucleotide-binding universal stress UspA family protein
MSKVHKIVVGVDGSESSITALRWALGEARLRGSEVEVIHTWSLTPMVDPMGFASYVPVEEIANAAKSLVEDVMKRVEEFVGKTKVSTKITRGPAAATTNLSLMSISARTYFSSETMTTGHGA